MVARDGDGWIECNCGGKHWGKHGAAGLLVIRDGKVLMQHRAEWVHNGNTWGIPGGARDSHESALEAALREAHEETGIEDKFLKALGSHRDDHGTWSYETIVVCASEELVAVPTNDESLELRWVPSNEVVGLNLHPSFAKTWPALQKLLIELFG